MNNNFILTILIPTYNRSLYICRLLQFFENSSIYKTLTQDIEIVIADNCSNDEKAGNIKNLYQAIPNCRLISHEEHVPTAEENVFRSFKNCSGEYIWVLGDDDIPVFENLCEIISELKSNQHDFLIFNSPIIGRDSAITSLGTLKIHGQKFTDDIVKITMQNGFWFVLAGMSSQILRASFVKDYDFATVMKESIVYSHVTAYLDCFRGKQTTCFNYPLVWYKVTYRDISHWQKAAQKMDVFDEYFWTLGFIKQLKFLTKKGILNFNSLFYSLDQNEFYKFRLINVVHEKFYNQLLLGTESGNPRQLLKQDDFYEIFDFLLASSIYLRESLWDMEKIYKDFLAKKQKPTAELKSQICERFPKINSDLLYGFFIRNCEDYLIYKIFDTYYAIKSDHIEYLKEELRYVNPQPSIGLLYIENSIEKVELLIRKKESDTSEKSLDSLKKVCEFYKNLTAEKDLLLQKYSASIHERDAVIHRNYSPSKARNKLKKSFLKRKNQIKNFYSGIRPNFS